MGLLRTPGRKTPKSTERRPSRGSVNSSGGGDRSSPNATPQAVWGGKKDFSLSEEGNRRFYDIIIVGGGIASGYCANELVKQGVSSGKVLLISGESIPPYERGEYCWKLLDTNEPPKDHFTCTKVKGSNQNAVWYAVNGIDLLLETFVIEFHGGDRTLHCSNNMFYTATRAIVVATGSVPKQLPIAPNAFGGEIPFDQPLVGLHYFSNQTQALAVSSIVHTSNPDHVVVVGAGFLGIQLTSHLVSRGIKVTVICKHSQIVPYLFPDVVAATIEAEFEKLGVTFIKKNRAVDARGLEGQLTGIRLNDGTDIATSHAVVCIGHRARSAVFRQLQMKDEHIVVDHYFRTNCPGVYAIGDVSAFPLVDTNARINQHATDARRSGVHCAKVMLKDIAANPDAGLPICSSTSICMNEDPAKLYASADIEDAYEPSSNLVSLSGPCALDITFMGETIGDEIVSIVDEGNPSHLMSIWIRDWRVLGVLIGNGAVTQRKVLQLAVKHQVLVDTRKLKACTLVDDAVEVICEKLYLVATTNNQGQQPIQTVA